SSLKLFVVPRASEPNSHNNCADSLLQANDRRKKHLMSPEYMGGRRNDRRFWRPMFSLPQAGCSIMADHSGLCLDVLNGSTDNTAAVQQARFRRLEQSTMGIRTG